MIGSSNLPSSPKEGSFGKKNMNEPKWGWNVKDEKNIKIDAMVGLVSKDAILDMMSSVLCETKQVMHEH